MADLQRHEIWNSETGITDLPADWPSLAAAYMRRVESEWSAAQAELKEKGDLARFSEEIHREWAIETGQIENLYEIERGVTQTLIEQGFSAATLLPGSTNKDPEYVLALITDQKGALEGLFDFVASRRPLSVGYIKELHAAMTRSQSEIEAIDERGNKITVPMLHGQFKTLPNYPVRDGVVYSYCPPEQTASEMDRLVAMHLIHSEAGVPPEIEAAWLHHRFTQIHPFQDGNGRVARALASLVMIRAGLFPVVVPLDEKSDYLDTLERADENHLKPFVLLLARRQQAYFRKATTLIAKNRPNSIDSAEATERLAAAIRHRDDARESRIQASLVQFSNLVTALATRILSRATTVIQQVDPSVSLSHTGRTSPVSSDPVTLKGFHAVSSVNSLGTVHFSSFDLYVTKKIRIVFFMFSDAEDLDDRLQCIFAKAMGFTWSLVSAEPFLANGAFQEIAEQNSLNEWIDFGVAQLFDDLRREL